MPAQRTLGTVLLFLPALWLSACSTRVSTQHYLAVFDPEQQVTQELYRIEIKGDSHWASKVDYASGWVPADDADLLTRDLSRNEQGKIQTVGNESTTEPQIRPSRRFFEVGPLAVSMTPEDGRFVVVMSSDPDYFFQKMAALSRFRDESAEGDGSREQLLEDLRKERIQVLRAMDEVRETGQ